MARSALLLGAWLAAGCAPDPFESADPVEEWRIVAPDGTPLGEARVAPGVDGGEVERIRTRDGEVEVEGSLGPGRCARRERLGRAWWEARAGEDGWSWRRGLERRSRPLQETPGACIAEVESPVQAGWRADILAWRALLPDLPTTPGDRREYRVLDLASGRTLALEVEARETLRIQVDGAEEAAVRAFAHTAAEGHVLWYAADRSGLLAVETPLARVRFEREGVALPARPEPSPPPGVEEVPWVVETPTLRLAGTLARPGAAGGPLPVAVLIHGSGPVDRDGNAGGLRPGTHRSLAWTLAARGLAVVRYDKRGVGGSAALGGTLSFTLDDLAGDVRTWMDHLVALPGLDPGRVLLVGHSEGGYIAPLVAGRDPRVRGVVLLAGPASRLDDVMRAQLRLLLAAHGVDAAAIEREARTQAAGLRAVASGRDRQVLSPGWPVQASEWLRSHLEHDPEAALRAVRAPVLAIFGRQDLQVPVEEAARMEAILADRPGNRVVVLDGLDHLLMPVIGAPGMGLYADPDRVVDPRVLDLVAGFLAEAAEPDAPEDRPGAETP